MMFKTSHSLLPIIFPISFSFLARPGHLGSRTRVKLIRDMEKIRMAATSTRELLSPEYGVYSRGLMANVTAPNVALLYLTRSHPSGAAADLCGAEKAFFIFFSGMERNRRMLYKNKEAQICHPISNREEDAFLFQFSPQYYNICYLIFPHFRNDLIWVNRKI